MGFHIMSTVSLIGAAFAFVACGVGLPTSVPDLPMQNAAPTPTPTITPTPTGDTHRAAISFGEDTPISDTDLLALLVKHNVKGRWAHIEVYEYSGQSVPSDATDPVTFVTTIREEVTKGYAPALTDHPTTAHARWLAEKYSRQDLRTSERARAEVAELIRSDKALTQAQQYVFNGGPIIYSVIAVGKEDDLRRLGAEERVQGFNIATIDQPWMVWPPFATPTPTPIPSGVGGQSAPTATPTPTPLPPQVLYDRILTLAARDLPGQPPFQTPTPTPTPTP